MKFPSQQTINVSPFFKPIELRFPSLNLAESEDGLIPSFDSTSVLLALVPLGGDGDLGFESTFFNKLENTDFFSSVRAFFDTGEFGDSSSRLAGAFATADGTSCAKRNDQI